MSPDPQFVQSRMFGDPQSWNLYGYVRNNPLRYVDPTGEAIELIGTDEQRRKQLEALQNAAGAAGKYLYDNVDKKTGRHFVGIYTNGPDGKGKDFSQINKVSSALSSIIKNEQIAQVHIVRSFDYLPNSAGGNPLSVQGAYGITVPGKNPAIYVQDPDDGYEPVDGSKMSDGKPGTRTLETVLLHELGHAWGFMQNIGNETLNNKEALDLENKVRQVNKRNAPTRKEH